MAKTDYHSIEIEKRNIIIYVEKGKLEQKNLLTCQMELL